MSFEYLVRDLMADGCLVAINVAKTVRVQTHELVSIQSDGRCNLRVVYRQLKGREAASIEEERIRSGPILGADNDVVSVAAHHLALIVDAGEIGVAGSGIIHGRELSLLVDEAVIHEILIFIVADYNSSGG